MLGLRGCVYKHHDRIRDKLPTHTVATQIHAYSAITSLQQARALRVFAVSMLPHLHVRITNTAYQRQHMTLVCTYHYDAAASRYFPHLMLQNQGSLSPLPAVIALGIVHLTTPIPMNQLEAAVQSACAAYDQAVVSHVLDHLLQCLFPQYASSADMSTPLLMQYDNLVLAMQESGIVPNRRGIKTICHDDINLSWTHSSLTEVLRPYYSCPHDDVVQANHKLTLHNPAMRAWLEILIITLVNLSPRHFAAVIMQHLQHDGDIDRLCHRYNALRKWLKTLSQAAAHHVLPFGRSQDHKGIKPARVTTIQMKSIATLHVDLLSYLSDRTTSLSSNQLWAYFKAKAHVPMMSGIANSAPGMRALINLVDDLCLIPASKAYRPGTATMHAHHAWDYYLNVTAVAMDRVATLALSALSKVAGLNTKHNTKWGKGHTSRPSPAFSNFQAVINCISDYPGCTLKIMTPRFLQASKDLQHIKHLVPPYTYALASAPASAPILAPWLAKLFPPTHLVDNIHMNIRLANCMMLLDGKKFTNAMSDLGQDFLDNTSETVPAFKAHKKWWRVCLDNIPIGTAQPRTVSTFMTGFTPAQDPMTWALLANNYYVGSLAAVNKRLKHASACLRKCDLLPNYGTVTPEISTALAYLELSSGRMMNKTDWQAEIANRTIHRVPIIAPEQPDIPVWLSDAQCLDPNKDSAREVTFLADLKDEVTKIAGHIMRHQRPVKESFSQFYQRRHEWVTSGSASGTNLGKLVPTSVADLPSDIRSERVTKRVWADHTPFHVIRAALKGRPAEKASASEKYENGKSRALYGVEPVHYVINTYATIGMEGAMHHVPGCEKGAPNHVTIAHELKRAFITELSEYECTMFDYADFNRQHTPEAQAMIFEVFAELGSQKGYHTDWVEANHWVARAKHNMSFTLPGTNTVYRVKQGMFSGTRSTDLINTILNIAYFNVAKKYVQTRYTIGPDSLYHVHQGDDVWVSSRSAVWARLMFYTLNNMGFMFQANKQMFGRQAGEYLRVMYRNGYAKGYTQRCIINYVLRQVQDDTIEDVQAMAGAFSASIQLLARRGVSLHGQRLIWTDVVSHRLAIVAPQPGRSHDRKALRVPIRLASTLPVVGGMGLVVPGVAPYLPARPVEYQQPAPSLEWALPASVVALETPMTHEWVAHISPKVHAKYGDHSLQVDALVNHARNVNYANIGKKHTHAVSKIKYKELFSKWLQSADAELSGRITKPNPMPQAVPLHSVDSVTNWIALYHATWMSRTTFSHARPITALASTIPASPQIVLQCNNIADLAAPLTHDVAKYEAQSMFKSVDLMAQALGMTVREAVLFMTSLETQASMQSSDAASTLRRHASESSNVYLQYALSRRVGFIGLLASHVAHTAVDLMHATAAGLILKSSAHKQDGDYATLARTEAAAATAMLVALRQRMGTISRLAY